MLAEAVKGITGLRRDPGAGGARGADRRHEARPDTATWRPAGARPRLQYIPDVGRLHAQPALRRRLRGPQADQDGPRLDPGRPGRRGPPVWATSAARAAGSPSACATSGSGTRPSSTSATPHTDEAEVTVWLWSPEAQPMDTALLPRRHGPGHLPRAARRPQHHLRGLRAGVRHAVRHRPHQRADCSGRCAAHPGRRPAGRSGRRRPHAAAARRPARRTWSPPGSSAGCSPRSTAPRRRRRRSRTSSTSSSTTTQDQVEQRRWYGFWDYGDIMHTYDADRPPGATTSAGTPGTTPSSRRTCGCGTRTCAPAAPTSSASPRR